MPGVLAAVEGLRRRGMRLPTLSCREVPPTADGVTPTLGPNDGCSPSVLVRRIIHLLHAVRPSLAVATRLEAGMGELERIAVPARDATLGLGAAVRDALQLLREIDQEIRARPEGADGDDAVRRLAIESLPPRGDATGVAAVELFTRRRFMHEGHEAVRQAARDATRRLIVVVDVGGEGGESDLARLADAAIPAGATGRVRVLRVDINDAAAVRARILGELGDGAPMLSVIVLADGPPARLDADAIERSFLERDRLGYQPQQRLVWPADIACELRPPAVAGLLDQAEEQGATPIQGRFAREDLGTRIDGVQFRAVALSEQVEVVRTKPP
ncbi:MAG: hypothetical protein ACO3QC_15180, partial [Phycisphaerales bacterium]